MINTDTETRRLRDLSIRLEARELLIARLAGSDQEPDISEPVNCGGLGRIRHFGHPSSAGWPANPVPQLPAQRHLQGASPSDEPDGVLRAQVFQNSACNWRCWYCYVPFALLGAHEGKSAWITADALVDLWRAEPNPPAVLDLSGGQPDLIPEWIPWTMRALLERGLQDQVYLWSDDNLSSDLLFQCLSDDDLNLLAGYRGYGRAVCFKGIDEESFILNTAADPIGHDRQFDLAGRLIDLGLDLYGYITLTTASPAALIPDTIERFLDRLQDVHELLPLRVTPLEVQVFSPVPRRMRAEHEQSLKGQQIAISTWNDSLQRRFGRQTAIPIPEIRLGQ